MFFSILIPVYNVKKYISQCFDSILSQSFRNFEVVIVDDGSTDGCSELCDGFANNNPDFVSVIHKPNGGLISARRTAVKAARGEYCVFLDSDDMLVPEHLETVFSLLQKYSMPDILIHSFYYIDDGGNRTVPADNGLTCGEILCGEGKKELYSKMICTTDIDSLWSKVIRTRLLKDDPTDYEKYYRYNMSEDLLQSLYPVTAAERIVCVSDRLYLYRYNPSSISRSVGADAFGKISTVHVYNELKRYMDIWGMSGGEWLKKLDANWLSQAAYNLDRMYLSAVSDSARNNVLSLDWRSAVSPDSLENISGNPYLSDSYKKVWNMLLSDDLSGLRRYFMKKKTYTALKKIKRKIIG